MIRQTFNLHTHTARCGHATGLDQQYIDSAIKAGFKLLGFSEHIPYPEMRLPNCRMFYEHKEEYLQTMKQLKKTYRGQIDIIYGYEVEYTQDHVSYLMEMKKDCDYMILGQHCKYFGYEYDCYCSDEDVIAYTTQIEQALEKGFITYIAHPDYFMMGRRTFSSVCEEAAHRIARASILHDIPLEINLNGISYGKKNYCIGTKTEDRYPYPFREFWEIISTYGCKILYGYDAHSPIIFHEQNRLIETDIILRDLLLNFVDHIQIK